MDASISLLLYSIAGLYWAASIFLAVIIAWMLIHPKSLERHAAKYLAEDEETPHE